MGNEVQWFVGAIHESPEKKMLQRAVVMGCNKWEI